MMNTKLGLNREKFKFTPICIDDIYSLDTIVSEDGKIELICHRDNCYEIVTSNSNAYMDLNIYKNMEFINESARIRRMTEENKTPRKKLWGKIIRDIGENQLIGTKESEGKLMTSELDSRFTKEMAKVMTLNKFKYPRGNKYKKQDPIEIFEAMERHLLAVKEHLQYGTSLIDDDGCNHIAKIGTNADILFIQLNLKNENK